MRIPKRIDDDTSTNKIPEVPADNCQKLKCIRPDITDDENTLSSPDPRTICSLSSVQRHGESQRM